MNTSNSHSLKSSCNLRRCKTRENGLIFFRLYNVVHHLPSFSRAVGILLTNLLLQSWYTQPHRLFLVATLGLLSAPVELLVVGIQSEETKQSLRDASIFCDQCTLPRETICHKEPVEKNPKVFILSVALQSLKKLFTVAISLIHVTFCSRSKSDVSARI